MLKRKTKEVVENAFYVIGSIEERATKIRTKKFNCVTKYSVRSRYICGKYDRLLHDVKQYKGKKAELLAKIKPIDDDEKCWETYSVPYESCDASKAVYTSNKLK